MAKYGHQERRYQHCVEAVKLAIPTLYYKYGIQLSGELPLIRISCASPADCALKIING